MYLLIIFIIVFVIFLYICNYKNKEKFTIKSDYNNNLNNILNSKRKKIIFNNVIPSEYKSYLLNILIYIFEQINSKSNGKIRFIPYQIIEIISNNNIIKIFFFANSHNGFNSLVFKAEFVLKKKILKLINIESRDISEGYGEKLKMNNNIYGIDTFKIIYPNLNTDTIDLDNISGIMNDKLSNYVNINYRINPIINPNLLRINILPKCNIPDIFSKYPNSYKCGNIKLGKLNKKERYLLSLGNNYIPGMFESHTSFDSMFSKLHEIKVLS